MHPYGMLMKPTTVELANRVVKNLDADAALELVRRIKPECITELVARSGVAGRLTTEVFEVLCRAYDHVCDEQAIRRLPGAA